MAGTEQLPRPPSAEALAREVRERARALGFDAVGIASADPPLDLDHQRLSTFLAAGWHGEMSYLADTAPLRLRVDRPEILAGARSVVCLARRYDRNAADEQRDPGLARLIARYARGRDYHGFLRKRLNRLAATIRALAPGAEARAFCDTGPLLERAWAARAGLGFVGKNGLLIVPGQGSYVLLGEVVTSIELPPDEPVTAGCGACTACLEACPAAALVAPQVLDARRCISYATIELRGRLPAAPSEAVAERLFGCDRCQEVCPHNHSLARPAADSAPFQPLPSWSTVGLGELCALDEARWRSLAAGSPLRRLSPRELARNALHVVWGRARAGDEAAMTILRGAAEHPDEALRRWVSELCRRL